MPKREGRIREPELKHALPTAQERAKDAVVHCTECKLDWSASQAAPGRKLCLNHARARVREAVASLRDWRRGCAPTEQERTILLDAQKNACAICTEKFGPKNALCAIRVDGDSAKAITCEPCGRAVDRVFGDPMRAAATLRLFGADA